MITAAEARELTNSLESYRSRISQTLRKRAESGYEQVTVEVPEEMVKPLTEIFTDHGFAVRQSEKNPGKLIIKW